MNKNNWQNNLEIVIEDSVTLERFFKKLSTESTVNFNDFLVALWRNDESIHKHKSLNEFVHDQVSATDRLVFSLQEILIKTLEEQPYSWHNLQLPTYQSVLESLYQFKKAFTLGKKFLAKTKVGITQDFFSKMIKKNEDDYQLKMDLGLLAIIRDDMQDNEENLKNWERFFSKKVDSCIETEREEYCILSLYSLPPLAYLWCKRSPEKVLKKCLAIDLMYDQEPEPAVLNHLAVYFRKSIINLCNKQEWENLVKIKNTARLGWVKELIEDVLNHPALEELSEQLEQKELEFTQIKLKRAPSKSERGIDEKAKI